MDNRPIGVFDSGLGGLTAVKELRRLMPGEDIVYFGDTGRIPYGTRGRETIIRYAKQDIAFLLSKDVKYILAACGTVSSTLPKAETDALRVPYMGVVEAAARAAVSASKNGKIGVLGTAATIASGSYADAIRSILPSAQITATSCPLFVPLVENGYFNRGNTVAMLVARDYLRSALEAGVDTIVMGCTHYPLLRELLDDICGGAVSLIDPGRETVISLKQQLKTRGMLNETKKSGEVCYFVSDSPGGFYSLAKDFLGEYAGGECSQISVETF